MILIYNLCVIMIKTVKIRELIWTKNGNKETKFQMVVKKIYKRNVLIMVMKKLRIIIIKMKI